MIESTQLSHLKESLDRSQKIIVIYPKGATFDIVASAQAIAEALVKEQKDVRLCSPEKGEHFYELEWGQLTETVTELGNQNLTISFDYNSEQVDKVSYHIGEDTGKFHLTIKPKKGQLPLNAQTVEFLYTGAEADLIIAVGVSNLEDLLQLYFGYEEMYRDTAMVSINNYETNFGTEKVNISQYSSYSEAITRMINDLGLNLESMQATNLLAGIDQSTQGFRSLSTTAETFETVARLLRSGGRRKRVAPTNAPSQPQAVPYSETEVTQYDAPSSSVSGNFGVQEPVVEGEFSTQSTQPTTKSQQNQQSSTNKRKNKQTNFATQSTAREGSSSRG